MAIYSPVKNTVDIVIPCYNYGHYLRDSVSSALSQDGVLVRVLIIDDASTDDSEVIGRELANNYSAVEFRRHATNKGHIATYNEGLISWSKSDFVALLSADDLLAPGSLYRATQVMDSDSTIGMVYGRTIHFSKKSELPKKIRNKFKFTKYQGDQWVKWRFIKGYNVITSPEVVVRGSIQRIVGGYRSELPHSGDLEMWLRIASISNVAYIYGDAQAYYRVHSGSMQRTKYKSKLFDFIQRKAAFNIFLQNTEKWIEHAAELQNQVSYALAREALWDACRAYDHNEVNKKHIEDLVGFALSSYPDIRSLPEFSALHRRHRLGPLFCNRTQVFIVPALFRWVIRRIRRWQWMRHGI